MQCRSHIIGAPWVWFYILSSTCLLEDQTRKEVKSIDLIRVCGSSTFGVLGMADSDRFDLVQAMDMQTGKNVNVKYKERCERNERLDRWTSVQPGAIE